MPQRADATANEVGQDGAITVLISHRFSSVRMADLIVVLANGMVTEVGTHAQLVEADDHYADMYNKLANAYR